MTSNRPLCRLPRYALAGIAAVAFTVLARPASASTIGISGTTLIAGAADFEPITLTAFTSGSDLLLTGVPFQIVTPGCTADNALTVRCALAGFTSLTIVGSELDDVVNVQALGALTVFVATRSGNDVILGGNGTEILSAGAGDDLVFGAGTKDTIFTGPGNDLVIGCCRSNGPTPADPQPLAAQPVPEPASLALFGVGLVLVAAVIARRTAPLGDRIQTPI